MKVSSLGPFGQSPPQAQLVAKPFVSAMSFARMDTFARGEISGMMKAGMTREVMRCHVCLAGGFYDGNGGREARVQADLKLLPEGTQNTNLKATFTCAGVTTRSC